MPRKDGTGPAGKGSGGGPGSGRGMGMKRGAGMGAGGDCICPKCGTKSPHAQGVPCNTIKCLKCGTTLVRG